MFSIAGRIPARGELVRHPSGIEFEVLEADPRRIKKLRIHVPPEPGEAEGGGPKANSLNEAAPLALPSPLRGPPERDVMTAPRHGSRALAGWRRASSPSLLGALSVLAFAPLHLWPVLFLTFGPLSLAARRLPPRPCAARRAAQMREPDRLLVRLRLFPRRTLLGRRGLSGRALAAWLADPVRHDRAPRRHGIVLRRGRGARHADVVAGSRPECSRSPSPSDSPSMPAAMC